MARASRCAALRDARGRSVGKRKRRPDLLAGYLLVDIEGSVGKAERRPKSMRVAERRYRKLVSEAVERHQGRVRDFSGDGVLVTLPAESALACALEIQTAIQARAWRKVGGLSARVGVHCGRADPDGDVERVLANRVKRIADSAWGGQIVASAAAVSACTPPERSEFVDFGHHRLKGLEEPVRLFGLTHPQLRTNEFPPLRSSAASGALLAPQAQPIFGRDTDLQKVIALLGGEAIIVSIIGPPGGGKTRLALEVGAWASSSRGVYFVSLEDATSIDGALAALANELAFPFHERISPLAQLRAYLRDKQFLIVFDNADAIVGKAAFLSTLGGPDVRFLVTSREPLGIEGETLVTLSGLSAGGPDCPVGESAAFLLFAQSARSVGVRLELDEAQFAVFAAICDEVAGSPLALQLLAHWTPVLTLREILERLRRGLEFLGELGGEQLQRGLQRAMLGSWSLLEDAQKRALAGLSIFQGGFELGAAAAVATVDAGMVAALERKCLIERHGRRYVLHPFVREHARVRLHEDFGDLAALVRQRHCDHFLALVRQTFSSPEVGAQRAMLDGIEADMANVKAAWGFAASSAPETARAAVESLFYALILRAHLADCVALFACPIADGQLAAHVEALRASCEVQLGEYALAEERTRAAIANAQGDWAIIGHCRQTLGNIAHVNNDIEAAREHYEEAFRLRDRNGDTIGAYYSAISLAWLNLQDSKVAGARDWLNRAFELCGRIGQFGVAIMAYSCAGDLAVREDVPQVADENYRRALEIEKALNHPHLRAPLLLKLGKLAERSDVGEASARYEQALSVAEAIGDRRIAVTAMLSIVAIDRTLEPDDARVIVMRAFDHARTLAPPQIGGVLVALAANQLDRTERAAAALVIGLLLWPIFAPHAEQVAKLRERLAPDQPIAPKARSLEEALQEVFNAETFGPPRLP